MSNSNSGGGIGLSGVLLDSIYCTEAMWSYSLVLVVGIVSSVDSNSYMVNTYCNWWDIS